MPKKKLAPPIWDEKNHRWKKTAYCNSMSKTFYSTKKGATSAEREITVAINAWKEKMEGLTGSGHLTPMSKVKDVYEAHCGMALRTMDFAGNREEIHP